MMGATLLEFVGVLLWPLALSAAAWFIAVNALAERDEISKVVNALTQPDGIDDKAKHSDASARRRNLRVIANGNGDAELSGGVRP